MVWCGNDSNTINRTAGVEACSIGSCVKCAMLFACTHSSAVPPASPHYNNTIPASLYLIPGSVANAAFALNVFIELLRRFFLWNLKDNQTHYHYSNRPNRGLCKTKQPTYHQLMNLQTNHPLRSLTNLLPGSLTGSHWLVHSALIYSHQST